MRLRLTVRRHGLPDTPVVWVVDTSSSPSPTISQLLEAVNEAIPIESDNDWGLEDYAVELKGANGANYECLHFQHIATVMKEDDEVIIRPLLTQDLKIRRVSGRRQISAEGKHLFDGLAFGRPLLRRPADRPPISIPPRKKRRILYDDEDEDVGDIPALMEREEEDTEDDADKQLVIHADFDDEDSEDDDDFVPGAEGDDEDLDEEAEDNLDDTSEEASGQIDITEDNEGVANEQAADNTDQTRDVYSTTNNEIELFHASGLEEEEDDESALENVPEPQRVKIRKLHAIFPKSPMAVCKYVLKGSNGDMGEAYEAIARGFRPVRSKTSFTKSLEDTPNLHVPRTRSKVKTPPPTKPDDQDLMNVDGEDPPDSLIRHYDQGGLPPGSIKSGKALTFMAEALRSSPARPRSEARRSASIVSNKSVRFVDGEGLSNGLTSTPFIDQQSTAIESESSESDSDESSEDDATSSEDSEDSDGSDSDESSLAKKNGADNASSSASESSSDSSSDSSSEEEPEEASSKFPSANHTTANFVLPSQPTNTKSKQSSSAPAGRGSQATRKRNERKRLSNALDRYKKKGILPAGTTISELAKLNVNDNTSPEVAFAALEGLRNAKTTDQKSKENTTKSQSDDFERRRQELLDSLASGGVDVDRKDLTSIKSTSDEDINDAQPIPTPAKVVINTEPPTSPSSAVSEHVESPPIAELSVSDAMDVEDERPSTAPEAPKADTPLVSPKSQPASTESSQNSTRRSKIDLGAGRRLLFGALGIKAPRTKKDEEKLRADLMKDVRPLVIPKAAESVEVQAEDEAEPSNAWREKIVYRAVECVQEGVELSEPPFPFVQRWDPQQQGPWSHNGKRNQAQREHPGVSRPSKKQKRRKGKHSYSEEQEYLEASYEPSYQEDSMQLQYDDSTQLTGLEEEHVEDEISLQLMNDIASTTAAVSQEPEDCILLPEDLSTLKDLKDGDAKVRMLIAFKMLDFSAATQWQPEVSSYRTAVVIGIQENGVLNLTLAMRDRKRTEKRYDDTGKRVYGKFETVDDDNDMQDDNGMIDLAFGELIEPKILQEPPGDYVDDVLIDEASQMQEEIGLPDSMTSGQQESAEEPLSHVTETTLHSDAPAILSDGPETYQVKESVEVAVDESAGPELPIQVELAAESKIMENPIPTEIVTVEESAPSIAHEEAPPIAFADSIEMIDELQSKKDIPAEPIPETAKEQIAHLMKDTNFRADLPSSVLREIQPESMQSPGEAVALEKLLKEMTESSEKAYSPKFNGLGSSPIKKLRESSATPTASESRNVQVANSSPTREQKPSQQPRGNEHRQSISPNKPPQSSWETVDPQYQSPTPSPARQADSSWVTEDSHLPSSSPPVAKPVKATPAFKPLARRVPVGKAQALWEALQSKHRKESSESEDESNKNSTGLDGADEKDSNAGVQYPKLSMGSSFTSQVTDHGRQPDFDFDSNNLMDVETPRAADFDADMTGNLSPEPERQLSLSPAASPRFPNNAAPDSESEFEPPLPRKTVIGASGKPPGRSKVRDSTSIDVSRKSVDKKPFSAAAPPRPDLTSSDEDFPTLEALSQQSATIKREKSRERSMRSPKLTKADKHSTVSGPSRLSANSSEDENQTTPKASQKRRSQSQSSKSRASEKPQSQFRTTAPRTSQPIPVPPGSQVVDLTISSSDAEPDPQPDTTVSSDLDIQPTRFRKYNLDTDDDEDYEEESGWASKKISTLGVPSRQQTSSGLKTSSQTSLNTKNRRQTNAR